MANVISRRQFIQLAGGAAVGVLSGCNDHRKPVTWSERMADSVLNRRPRLAERWNYEAGVILSAMQQVWQKTGQPQYYRYLKANIDQFIAADGQILTYQLEKYNLDQLNSGKLLFLLYRESGDERYRQAIDRLVTQLQTQPRTSEGGFWHKQIYPYQMWLDGIYMAAPFYAEFAHTFNQPAAFDEVVHQITLIERHTRDPHTGLLYHGWDERKSQRWANPHTGSSPCFWGRAVGWYLMALVDVLDFLPQTHIGRPLVTAILERLVAAVAAVQDSVTGLWYQVLDQGNRAGNYREASVSCMVVYALLKGVSRGYLAEKYKDIAARAYHGILTEFIKVDESGLVNLHGVCGVAGLGGEPYRDGSFAYYVSQKTVTNDNKGVGPFIMASLAVEATVPSP